MALLNRISNNFTQYFSSTPKHAEYSKTSASQKRQRRSPSSGPMSPGTRTRSWLHDTEESVRPINRILDESRSGRTAVTKHVNNANDAIPRSFSEARLLELFGSPITSFRKFVSGQSRQAHGEPSAVLDDGDTLIDDCTPANDKANNEALKLLSSDQPMTSSSSEQNYVYTARPFSGQDRASSSDYDIYNDDTLVETEEKEQKDRKEVTPWRVTRVTDVVEEEAPADQAARTSVEASQAKRKGSWTEEELKLFKHIQLRGFEPLLPVHWDIDYPTFPRNLFTRVEAKQVIYSVCDKDFRAQKALYKLMELGPRVRSLIEFKKKSDQTFKEHIDAYIRWAAEDGEYARTPHIPITTFASIRERPGMTPTDLQKTMERRLLRLADRYRQAFRAKKPFLTLGANKDAYIHAPPTLIGFMLSRHRLAIVSYAVASAGPPLATGRDGSQYMKVISILDFSDHTQDVWSALAIAIVVCAVREWFVELKRCGYLGLGWEGEKVIERKGEKLKRKRKDHDVGGRDDDPDA